MPRLKNRKHELYCYGRIYYNLPKIRACEFAGYAPYPMSYRRIEERPEVQARLEEMQATPQEKLYDKDAPPEPMAIEKGYDLAEQGVEHVSNAWLMHQLKVNMEQAREAGKFKDANEAIRLMGGLLRVAEEEDLNDPVKQRARAAGIDLKNVNRTRALPVPQESPIVDDVGEYAGSQLEAGEAFTIPSPDDVEDAD